MKGWKIAGSIAGMLFTMAACAQNLTGIWRGTFFNPGEIALGGAKYRYEVQINNQGREASGVTYSYQTTRFYGKASLVGVWSPSAKNLVIQENRMLDLKIVGGGDGCLMTCYLTYRKEGGKEYLEGTYSSTNMHRKDQNCGGGRVYLEKVPDTDFELEDFLVKKGNTKGTNQATGKVKPGQEDFLVKTTPPATKPPASKPPANTAKTPPPAAKPPAANTQKTPPPAVPPTAKKEVEKQPEPVVKTNPPVPVDTEPVKPKPIPQPPKVLKERENELFKTIVTADKVVEISFFDNGEIDGDTISIYNNNRLMVHKKGLSAKPIVLKIELSDEEAQQDIVMVAENLGAIPPNTALMIVQAGKQRFTLNLSSTEKKNAMVRFKYQPD